MTNAAQYDRIMDAIKRGIAVARRDPKSEDADSCIAWCVLNELRRGGWTIVPNSN